MLADKDVAAILPVSDLARAKRFYGETLGLRPAGDMGDSVASYASGGTKLVIYVSEFAGTNKANAAVWDVGGELEAVVAKLKAKGVTFERYDDLPGLTRDGDIHASPDGRFKAVWFKDPDGNILHINSDG